MSDKRKKKSYSSDSSNSSLVEESKHNKDRSHHKKSSKKSKSKSREKEKKSKYKEHRRTSSDNEYKKKRRYDDYRKDKKSGYREIDSHRDRDRNYDSHRRHLKKRDYKSKSPNEKIEKKSHSDAARKSEKTEKKLPTKESLKTLTPLPGTSQMLQQKPLIIPSTPAIQPIEATVDKAALPGYYNPSVVNATKFIEQQKKRKLLWSNKKDDEDKWSNTKFSQDSDGTKANKFMRLMGIKEAKPVAPKSETNTTDDLLLKNMEQQYEIARNITHLARGQGFGFHDK